MEELRIISIGEENPHNKNCGRHELGIKLGSINIWFGDNFDFKTADEALEFANELVLFTQVSALVDELTDEDIDRLPDEQLQKIVNAEPIDFSIELTKLTAPYINSNGDSIKTINKGLENIISKLMDAIDAVQQADYFNGRNAFDQEHGLAMRKDRGEMVNRLDEMKLAYLEMFEEINK